MSACTGPVKLVKCGTIPAGMPVSRIASRSARGLPVAFSAARCGNTPGYRTGSSLASSGWATYLANCLSHCGACRFQRSFAPMGTMTSLNSGFPSRETWVNGPWCLWPAPSPLEILTRWRSAEVQTPIVWWPGLVTLRDRDLDGDRVHVQAVGGVDAVRVGHLVERVEVLERAQVAEVEDRAEVDVELLGALAGEDLDAVADVVHGRRCPGCARSPGWTRRRRCTAGRPGCSAMTRWPWLVHPGDPVELLAVPVRVAQRADRAGVVEEAVRRGQLRVEAEAGTRCPRLAVPALSMWIS